MWPATPGRVAAERARWTAIAPTNYTIEVRVRCFCAGNGGWYRVTVRDGRPTSQVALDAPSTTSAAQPPLRSVDSLFVWVERALGRPGVRPNHLRVRYDGTWHYPRWIAADLSPGYDDEFFIEARALTLAHDEGPGRPLERGVRATTTSLAAWRRA